MRALRFQKASKFHTGMFVTLVILVKLSNSEGLRFCDGSSNFHASGCDYEFRGNKLAVDHKAAVEFCKTNNAFLGPKMSDPADFKFFAQRASECGRLHTAYSYDSANDTLILDGIAIKPEGYAWKNDSRPSEEFPCIVAEYAAADKQLIVMPERCDVKLMYICVEDPCFGKSCGEGQTCSVMPGICGYQCVDTPTTTATTTATTTTTTTTETLSGTTTEEDTTITETTTSVDIPAPSETMRTSSGATTFTDAPTYVNSSDGERDTLTIPPGSLEPWSIAVIAVFCGVVAIAIIVGIVVCRRKICSRENLNTESDCEGFTTHSETLENSSAVV